MIEIFSYWIFIWFILYYFNLVKHNPLFLLIIAYVITFFEFIYLWYHNTNTYNLTKFFVINVIIKFIPIMLIFKYPFVIHKQEIWIGLYTLCLYGFIMMVFNKQPYTFYKQMLNTYINDSDNTKYKSYFSIVYDKLMR